jgi:fatty acid-binding protein DegV
MPMEKVRTRVQAIERLVEFAVEFTEIDDAVIVQHKPFLSEQTRMLQDRLTIEFPGRVFPHALYGPSLAALIGVDAMGLVVLERELDRIEDDF